MIYVLQTFLSNLLSELFNKYLKYTHSPERKLNMSLPFSIFFLRTNSHKNIEYSIKFTFNSTMLYCWPRSFSIKRIVTEIWRTKYWFSMNRILGVCYFNWKRKVIDFRGKMVCLKFICDKLVSQLLFSFVKLCSIFDNLMFRRIFLSKSEL